MKILSALIYTVFISSLALAELPPQPTESIDPGSANYTYTLFHETTTLNGRSVEFFAPAEVKDTGKKVPLIVFGHGQAIGADNYRITFEHLAKKGVAVMYPTYDTGFFDQDWLRMGQDYVALTKATLAKYADYLDIDKVIFSGHSKGAYIALNAAGVAGEQNFPISAVVVFEPAGYLPEQLQQININVPVTVTFAEADTVIKQSLLEEIYSNLKTNKKQFIHVSSYSELPADHYFPLSKSFFMGGHNGATAFHYYGVWKWLLGASWSIDQHDENPYLYGDQAGSTGLPGLTHKIDRNW